jgi:hypothetical protein
MDEHRTQKVSRIRALVRGGKYEVNAGLVADALIADLCAGRLPLCWYGSGLDAPRPQERGGQERRVGGAARHHGIWRRSALDQSACSYPRSGPVAPLKTTSGLPARTWPIQLSAIGSWLARTAASATQRAAGGTQAQSS